MNDLSDEVIEVRKLHPKEWAMDGNRSVELGAECLVQSKTRLPLLFRLNANQAIASEFYSSTKFSYFRQEGKLFCLAAHADH
jgi:hypothetical protein